MKDITTQLPINGELKKHRRKAEKKVNDLNKGMHKLFVDELQDIYGSEKILAKASPKMIKNAKAVPLKEVLTSQLELSKKNITRLEEAFAFMGEKTESKKCRTMACLLKNARSIIKETDDGIVKDAAIISAGLKFSHYKIASYTALCAFAEVLGENNTAFLLNDISAQVKTANERLTELTSFSLKDDSTTDSLSVTVQKQLV
jgi:ferritin-like metal-binding protein YciE